MRSRAGSSCLLGGGEEVRHHLHRREAGGQWAHSVHGPALLPFGRKQQLEVLKVGVAAAGALGVAHGGPSPPGGPAPRLLKGKVTTWNKAACGTSARVNMCDLATSPHVSVLSRGDSPISAPSHRNTPLIGWLESAVLEAKRQHESWLDLEAKLEENVQEAASLELRYCQLMQDYEDLQQQYSEAVKSPNSKQQQQQQQEQQYESEANSSVAGEPVSSAQPPAAPQTPPQLGSRVSQMPRPPVLALEASRLLPGADPEIGFGTADLEQEVHEFCACLTASVNPHAESPYALALTNSITSSLLGRAAQEHGNHAPLSGLRPCFLGHVIMHWVDMEIWADPMAALGCALGLGTGPLPRGPDEANLLSLIRSHAARRWCEVTKAAGDAGSIGGSAATAAASVGARVQQLQRRLAAWLGNFPSLAAALEADPHIRCLVLRALHLGLFALASHPLLRVRVSPVVFVLPCEARTLQQLGPSQVVRRHIRLSSGRGGPEAPPHGKHVLCSLQPSVGFWMGAEGVGAGSTGQVVVREEVVTWEWNQNSWVPFM